MKNLTVAPMSSYTGKIAGLIIMAVGLILILVLKLHGPFLFLSNPAADRQIDLVYAITVAGMYMTAFSKEKNDDERVRAIRAKSLQVAFMIFTGSMTAISLTNATAKEPLAVDGSMICALAAFGLGVYLVFFHIGLYFDPAWNYNDDTVTVNMKKNKTFFVIYFIAGIALLALAFLIHKA